MSSILIKAKPELEKLSSMLKQKKPLETVWKTWDLLIDSLEKQVGANFDIDQLIAFVIEGAYQENTEELAAYAVSEQVAQELRKRASRISRRLK